MAVLAVLLVLDATRRVIGWALPITALLFLAYALLATDIKLQVMLEQLYLSTEGIFGSTLGVSATYVIVFVLFGSFMEKSRHRQAVHGLRAGAHRPHRRRPGQGVGGQLEPVRHHLGQRGGQRHGRRADDHPADEAQRIQAGLRRRRRSHRVHRRADHAADHGCGRLRDGRVPGGELFPGHDVGLDPGAAVLRGGVRRRALPRQARRPDGPAAQRTAAPGRGAGRARTPVHPDPHRAAPACRCRSRRRCARWSVRCPACRWRCCAAPRAQASAGARCSKRCRAAQGRAVGGHGLRLRRHRHRHHLAHRAGHHLHPAS